MEEERSDPIESEDPAAPDDAAGADDPEPRDSIWVDQLGVPSVARAGGPATLLVLGAPETARQRLGAAGELTLVTDVEALAEVDLVLISTRLPRGELVSTMAAMAARAHCPIVVLAHTGGEGLAVELVRNGAVAVVAEGNETALLAVLSGGANDTSLVDTYDRQMSHSRGGEESSRRLDEITGLPRAHAFEQQLVELEQTGEVPRVGFARILHLEDAATKMAPAATEHLRRRLALQYREIAKSCGVELFALSDTDLGLISTGLSPHQAEELGKSLAAVTESYAPSGNQPLALALGHAGSEVTSEVATLRGLAQRALMAAIAQPRSAVVGADALALGVSSTTELEAAVRILEHVEAHDGHAAGHGERVADLASELAWELGYEGPARVRIRLAAHVHDIGKGGLPKAAMAWSPDLDGDLLRGYRSHPVRGADYLRVSAGEEIADAVRSHQEHWDGSGFPDGLSGESIPLAARIVAVANRFDRYRCDPLDADGRTRTLAEALALLGADAGTILDPSIVAAATTVFARLDADRLTRDPTSTAA